MHHPKRKLLAATVAMGTLALSVTVAALQQPDGTTIPVAGSQLGSIFSAEGESIDLQGDAAFEPSTFSPECTLRVEVLGRFTSFANSFGWYNVTGSKPTPSEHHELIACDDPVGTVRSIDILGDPDYLGGEVGFYQAVGTCATVGDNLHIVYTEAGYDPDATSGSPNIHRLVYDSKATDGAYYFAWEDLLAGGDNDFADLVVKVDGLRCSGGGAACDTGMPGLCGAGVERCRNGVLTCEARAEAVVEDCNGLDDDCDGFVDETLDGCGAALCGGVTCPYGQVCLEGSCADPCGDVSCADGEVCLDGLCVEGCACRGCGPGESCDSGSALCVTDACADVSCGAGTHCEAGACVDDCVGAVCPSGQVCETGACVAEPDPADAGTPMADGGTAADGGASSADGGSPSDGGTSGTDGGSGAADAGTTSDGDGGCGVGGAGGAQATWLVLLALGLRRRRRR